MVAAQIFGAWLDGSSAELRQLLGELEGVSEETLRRIDFVSRPTMDGPIPHHPNDVMLYDRLVMLALAEHLAYAQAKQRQPRARARAAS